MYEYTPEFLSAGWLAINGAFVGLCVLLVLATTLLSEKKRFFIATLMGSLLLFDALFFQVYMLWNGVWLACHSLPLSLCYILEFVMAFALITRSQLAYEICLVTAIVGPFQAFISPAFAFGVGAYFYISYVICHGLIILGPLYMTAALEFRPSKDAWLKGLKFYFVIAPVVYIINILVGGNYIFLQMPPEVNHPLLFLPWPWHIFYFAAVLTLAGYGINNLILYLTKEKEIVED